jgi:hypothetical protein
LPRPKDDPLEHPHHVPGGEDDDGEDEEGEQRVVAPGAEGDQELARRTRRVPGKPMLANMKSAK